MYLLFFFSWSSCLTPSLGSQVCAYATAFDEDRVGENGGPNPTLFFSLILSLDVEGRGRNELFLLQRKRALFAYVCPVCLMSFIGCMYVLYISWPCGTFTALASANKWQSLPLLSCMHN